MHKAMSFRVKFRVAVDYLSGAAINSYSGPKKTNKLVAKDFMRNI